MTTETVVETFQLELETPAGLFECTVEAHSKCYYHPGRLSGPPEDCYPSESDQETTVEVLDCAQDGTPVPLTPELLQDLEAAIPWDWMEGMLWKKFMRGPGE